MNKFSLENIKKGYQDLVKYLKSVRSEVKRISWPSSQELKASTIVVIITLVIMTTYLYIVDSGLAVIFTRLSKLSF